MVQYKLIKYEKQYFEKWNQFVDEANGGTIFHRLDFLEYHKEKFKDEANNLIILKDLDIFGIFPMAVFTKDKIKVVESPYGASYGGPLFNKPLNYEESKEIIDLLLNYFEKEELSRVFLTFPIRAAYKQYSEVFRFTLLEKGFSNFKRDIESVIYLGDKDIYLKEGVSKKAKNYLRKKKRALRSEVKIIKNASLKDFWQVLESTFLRHGGKPTHNFQELEELKSIFPNRIKFDVAYYKSVPIGGIAIFTCNKEMATTFYLVLEDAYKEKQALTYLICETIEELQAKKVNWLNLGTSSVNMQGRDNIFRFKESLGALGMFRETYLWKK